MLDRFITDNVLLVYEVLHAYEQKRTWRNGFLALKLDMSKAYNRVELPFLKGMMLKMGFSSSFVDFILHCISSVSYSIIINGEEMNEF